MTQIVSESVNHHPVCLQSILYFQFLWGLLLLQAVSSVITAPAPGEVLPIYASGFQHHVQDNFGGYNYGYSNKDSAKEEIRHPDGSVVGSYRNAALNFPVLLQTFSYLFEMQHNSLIKINYEIALENYVTV